MELLWIIGAGIVVLPFFLLFSVLGAYSRIRHLEEGAQQMRRAIDALVRQQWDERSDAGAASRPEPVRRARPAGPVDGFDEDAMPASGFAGVPPIPSPASPPVTGPLAGESLPVEPRAAEPRAPEPLDAEPSEAAPVGAQPVMAEPAAPEPEPLTAEPAASEPEPEPLTAEPAAPEPPAADRDAASVVGEGAASASPPSNIPQAVPATPPVELPPAWRDRMPDTQPGPGKRALAAVFRWLVTGNLVAKLGLVILFLGIAFLLKYVAAQIFIPIELRLAAIGAADSALLAWGWRIRGTRRGIGLPVQGTAIAILMLLVFASYRTYALIPGGTAFALLFALTVFTCLLAVLQDAVWLALFGIAGGFLAPVLTSSGTGNHIALFSYYAVLDAGILAIALKRSWRALNVVGFAFTTAIGVAWGMSRYTPGDYLSAQCFLLLFFLFFTAISLVYAVRQPGSMKNRVDGALVFGTPLLGAALQWALVRDIPFGTAFSALGGGVFYTALAMALWRRRGDNMRMLVESFLAMGMALGTVTIPLALDARWASAAWAVEGAALAWVGLRHGRRLMWGFGLVVQFGSWMTFLHSVAGLTRPEAVEAHMWLGFLILAVGTGLMSRLFSRAGGARPGTAFDTLGVILLCLATAWLLAGTWAEIILRAEGAVRGDLLAVAALAVTAGLSIAAVRAGWHGARSLALMVQLLAGVTLLLQVAGTWRWSWQAEPYGRPLVGVVLVTAAALATAWRMAHTREVVARRAAPGMFAWAALWWFGPLLDTCAGYLAAWTGIEPMPRFLPFLGLWPAYGICLAVSSVLLAWAGPRLRWRTLRWLTAPCWAALAVAMIELLLELYAGHLPPVQDWIALATLLAAGEYLLHRWPRNGWPIGRENLLALHTIRSAGPWLMIWPLGFLLIGDWLAVQPGQRELLARAGWETAGSWARYIPLWVQMMTALWLLHRARARAWPARPVAEWYGKVLLPLAAAWAAFHVVAWNLTQDGAMAPLPYLPLANPLDLSTGFAAVFVLMLCRGEPGIALPAVWRPRLPWLAMMAAFAWLNLILLRSASHWLDLPYRADALFASRAVQAALSLMWTVAALVLMRRAVGRMRRQPWLAGAAMLGVVVAKLFLVDLDGSGSMERIVSFVGVGLLMVVIGYLAPYPAPPRQDPEAETAARKGDPA